MRGVTLLTALSLVACAETDTGGGRSTLNELPVRVDTLETSTILPGTAARLVGDGFLEDADFSVSFEGQAGGRAFQIDVPAERLDDNTLELSFAPERVQALPDGAFAAVVRVTVRLGAAVGTGERSVSGRIAHRLVPTITQVARGVFPASPVQVRGDGFIHGEEGQTVVELRGQFFGEDGTPRSIDATRVAAVPSQIEGWNRDEAAFVFFPSWVGIQPGRISGQLRATNEGRGWRADGEWIDLEADLLPPAIEGLGTLAASRGQAVPIMGQGFVGGDVGGTTVLRLQGTFHAANGESRPLPPGGLDLLPERLSGTELLFNMRVEYDFDCRSDDLGADPGVLSGTVTPVINWQGTTVEGGAVPLEFEVRPTRQVVWIRFLPEFTDSLRRFGLRNVSAEVKGRILDVVRRDYQGINLEVREVQPTDFLEYSIVEIGGPDPNQQQLFGLDNTTGLDRCNQRLDDFLAGLNADSDSFGGIFVESFLQLSPSRGTDNPLAHPAFDEIFDPVIDQPVEAGEYPGGARDPEVERAIRSLGNLVGNTATHEIGHSLGLPVAPGCGEYHNAPGPQQIMDCGIDRPFEERVELEPGGQARWTGENRVYLEQILPLD